MAVHLSSQGIGNRPIRTIPSLISRDSVLYECLSIIVEEHHWCQAEFLKTREVVLNILRKYTYYDYLELAFKQFMKTVNLNIR